MIISKAISLRIRELLRDRNLSQYRLEQMTGIPHNSMLCIMNYRYNSANLKTIFIIIDAFDMSVSEFFDSPFFDLHIINLD